MADLQLEELEEMPEIAYKLGIVPHDWKNETAGIWADNELEEAVPSGVRVSTTLPLVVLVRWACSTLVLSSTTMCRSVPLYSWKAGNW